MGESQHRAAIRLLGRIGGDMRLQQPHEHLTFDHSYCSAARTFRRAARLAGKMAASRPAMIAAITKTISVPHGIASVNEPSA